MSEMFEGIDFSAFDKVGENQKQAKSLLEQTPVGGQVELLLADVMEDPDQPRRHFDRTGLEELAESIKKRGVVQPIIVRPKNEAGKYVIVMGARRYRASQLAGVKKIPVVIRVKPSDGYDQMIENIQRENLLHADIARFIEQEIAKGEKPSNIALLLGKPRSWVSLYIGFSQMHEVVREQVEALGIRVAYELQKAIEINEAATLDYMRNNESITQRGVMVFARSLKKDPSVEYQDMSGTFPEVENDGASTEETNLLMDLNVSAQGLPTNVPTSNVRGKRSLPIAIIVQVGERAGRLMTDRAAGQGSQFGVVSFDNGMNIEEIALPEIKLLEIITIE